MASSDYFLILDGTTYKVAPAQTDPPEVYANIHDHLRREQVFTVDVELDNGEAATLFVNPANVSHYAAYQREAASDPGKELSEATRARAARRIR